MISRWKRTLVGSPLASEDEQHQRLGIPTALAVFASDAISSTAYASQEILIVLIPAAGLSVALNQLIPISIIVMVLLVLVITSYRQTIFAYPGGGGSYVVSRENLGETPSLVAGASLLVDYILTVAVSVSAGRRSDHVGVPGAATRTGRDLSRVHRDHDDREPPWAEGIRPVVRWPDLRLHRRPRFA